MVLGLLFVCCCRLALRELHPADGSYNLRLNGRDRIGRCSEQKGAAKVLLGGTITLSPKELGACLVEAPQSQS
jgi:hypothetical protein